MATVTSIALATIACAIGIALLTFGYIDWRKDRR
jgi:hypothetical protein